MEHETKTCHRCGGTLADGFVQSRGMAFVKKYRRFRFKEKEGDFLLSQSFTGTFLPAQYCEQCDSITIFSARKGE